MKEYDIRDFNCGSCRDKILENNQVFINCLKLFVFTYMLKPRDVQERLVNATPELKELRLPYLQFAEIESNDCPYEPSDFFDCRFGQSGYMYNEPTTYHVTACDDGLHALRKQFVAAEPKLYQGILANLLNWFNNAFKTKYENVNHAHFYSFGNSRITVSIIMLKIYLGIDLTPSEGEFLADGIKNACNIELYAKDKNSYFTSLRDIGEDHEFAAALPKNTLSFIYKAYASAFVMTGYPRKITTTLRPLLEAQGLPSNSLESYFCSLEKSDDPTHKVLGDFFTGNFEAALNGLAAMRKGNKNNRYAFPFTLEAMFQFCRMMLTKDVAMMRKELDKYIKKGEEYSPNADIACISIKALEQLRLGRKVSEVEAMYNEEMENASAFYSIDSDSAGIVEPLFIASAACSLKLGTTERIKIAKFLNACLTRAIQCTPKLAKIYAKSFLQACKVPDELLKDNDYYDFSSAGKNENAWKVQLDSLNELLGINKIISQEKKQSVKFSASTAKEKRLIWIYYQKNRIAVPAVVVIDADGNLYLSKFFDSYAELTKKTSMNANWMTDKDRDIVRSFDMYDGYRRGTYNYTYSATNTPKELIGHEHVYFIDKIKESWVPSPEILKAMKHVRVIEGKCKMIVTEAQNDWHVAMDYGDFTDANGEWGFEQKDDALILRKITKIHRDIQQVLGDEGRKFPKEVFKDLSNLAKSNEIEVCFNVKAEDIQGNAQIIAMFSRAYGSYFLRMRVKPNPNDDSHVKIPGEGELSILGHDGIRPLHYVRDAELELKNAETVINGVSILKEFDEEGPFSYSTESLEYILEALEQLNSQSDLCSIEWQDGKKMYVSKTLGAQSFKLTSTLNKQNWLAISGELEIEPNRYISLRSMLESIDAAKGRFLKVDNDKYIALTTDLKKRLEKLKALTQPDKDGELTAHPLASAAFDNVLDGINSDIGESLGTLIKKRQDAMNYTPKIPKTLQAELRNYQQEGFEWLARLKKWGVGACLADDMGLGKTVQTIAAMLLAAPNGPIMVIAPTSVCPNWEMEIHKFAPTLTVKRLKEADDRKEFIQGVGKNEVMIVSYGLFAIEAGPLSEVAWEMAVFDEAQALKNDLTKRAKTAAFINAKMKIALTGTPIENNLDDLWSIFNVINKGLLGSKQNFHDRFSNVVNDKNTNKILKLLISPFILRRLKSDVLQDLPPRTEQVITVEPTNREKELYETMRLKTCEDLENNKLPANKSGQRRLQILAALTKLRQLCCDPALMSPELSIGTSSKTEAFADLLDEAISGGHRLLVFSQFVGYLDKIRKLLERKNVSYKYLDGQTPEKKRRTAISEFQSGDGDVFLISLRAGGQGLNLTGADYVVHLDPWWNPAVEDQATDRAYRIGQTRPVNVFRLVMKDSLEEKILELHAQKRELAADFLTGTSDVAAEAMKLSEEELLNLLA